MPASPTIAITGAIDAGTLAAIQALPAIVAGRVSLDIELASPAATPSIAAIISFVSLNTGVSRFRIVSGERCKPAARARHAVSWGARVLAGRSFTVIARALGDRDRTTIISSQQRADRLRLIDPAFRTLCDRMAEHFGGIPA